VSDFARGGATKTIYKIFRIDEWNLAEREGRFLGSSDDIRDGFIHFSTAEQLRGTLAKYFASESEIVLAAVDANALGNDLKWEVSRGGMLFPHLYASISIDAVGEVTRHARDASGDFVLPAEIP
jgi:uncharacterized protein (DUF952 family)